MTIENIIKKFENKKLLKEYFDFVKRNYCFNCGRFDHWDGIKGTPIVSASHVLKKGSKRRDEHFNNLVPHCVRYACHQIFEELSPERRLELCGAEAVRLTHEFFERKGLK